MSKFIKINDIIKTSLWCSKIISPRTYYMYNSIGGKGWVIVNINNNWQLIIDNEKQALMAILQFTE